MKIRDFENIIDENHFVSVFDENFCLYTGLFGKITEPIKDFTIKKICADNGLFCNLEIIIYTNENMEVKNEECTC